MLDRRELLQRISMATGAALSAGTIAGVLAGCVATPGPAGTARAFVTEEEFATLAAMADHILPRTDTPGALDVGVPAFMDRMLAGFYPEGERSLMREGLRQAASDARALSGVPFSDLSPGQQVALMEGYDRAAYSSGQRHFFRLVKELVITGYCTSEDGARALLRYEQNPGPFRGDVPAGEIGKAWAL